MRAIILSALSIVFGAAAVYAADFDPYNRNGPPKDCPSGNVATFNNGMWICAVPSPAMTQPSPRPLYDKSTGGSGATPATRTVPK